MACDFLTATTLTGATYYVFAVIEHATRRVRVLGATSRPTGAWAAQLARNLVMDLQDAGAQAKYLIRDRDTKFTAAFDAVFAGEGIEIATTGVRVPRMNAICERCGHLPARTPGPHLGVEPGPPPVRTARVRGLP